MQPFKSDEIPRESEKPQPSWLDSSGGDGEKGEGGGGRASVCGSEVQVGDSLVWL